MQNQFNKPKKILWSDLGGEYLSTDFVLLLNHKGILNQCSCLHTLNITVWLSVKNRHIMETTRTFLLESSVPSTFWCEPVHMLFILSIASLYQIFNRSHSLNAFQSSSLIL